MRRRRRGYGAVTWLVVTAVIGVFLACGGRTVPPIPTCAFAPVDAVATVSPDEVWVAGELGTLLHLSAGKWTTVANPAGQVILTKIVMLSREEGWAVGTDSLYAAQQHAVIEHYAQGEWEPVSSPSSRCWSSLAMVSPNDGWAVGDGIAQYTRGTWTAVKSPTNAVLTDVAMVSPDEGWAVGLGGTLLHYTAGSSGTPAWTKISSPTSDNLYSVDMLSASEGWTVGGASILHYTNGVWHRASVTYSSDSLPSSAAPAYLYRVAMASPTDGWAVGDGGLMLHYDGNTWSLMSSPTDLALRDIAMISASDGWAVGGEFAGDGTSNVGQAMILRLRAGRWTAVESPVSSGLNAFSAGLHGLAMVSSRDGWAVGEGGTILHYDGTDWEKVAGWTRGHTLYSIAMVSRNEGWAVGDYGTILHFLNGKWAAQDSHIEGHVVFATTLHSIAMVSADDGWAVGDNPSGPVVLHYGDGQWNPVTGAPSGVALRSIAMVSADEGWSVGFSDVELSGVILHYVDGQWQQVPTDVNAELLAIAMTSRSGGWIVGSAKYDVPVFLHYASGQWVDGTLACQLCGANSVAPVSSNEGWAVGDHAIFHDVGGHWTALSNYAPTPFLQSVAMVSPQEGWAAGGWNYVTAGALSGAAILYYVKGHWTNALGVPPSLRLATPTPIAHSAATP